MFSAQPKTILMSLDLRRRKIHRETISGTPCTDIDTHRTNIVFRISPLAPAWSSPSTLPQLTGMNGTLLPVYSPTYPPENTSVTTSMPPSKPQKPSEALSAKGIARLTVHISSSFHQKMSRNVGVSASRWSTAEFKFYYMVALFVIPLMIWIPMSLSLRNFSFLLC